MSDTAMKKKHSYNALDVTVVLLVILLLIGAVGRVLLDRRNSKGLQDMTISFTCVVSEFDKELFTVGKTLYSENGEKLGSITRITNTVSASETNGDEVDRYFVITGDLSFKGYNTRNGVTCTTYGEPIRINTHISLKNGTNVQLYVNNIVENGQ